MIEKEATAKATRSATVTRSATATRTAKSATKQPKKQRFFEGLPVREGRGDILVQPTREDIKSANRFDPQNCAYAKCIKRMLQTNRVFIYATVAYVETMDEQGNRMMERYMITNHAHAYIRAFDKGEDVGPGGFILQKPTKGRTLEHKRITGGEYIRAHPEKQRTYSRSAYEKYKAKRDGTYKAAGVQPKELTGSNFRSGIGKVHFIGTEGILLQES